jgi:hypothetical protein
MAALFTSLTLVLIKLKRLAPALTPLNHISLSGIRGKNPTDHTLTRPAMSDEAPLDTTWLLDHPSAYEVATHQPTSLEGYDDATLRVLCHHLVLSPGAPPRPYRLPAPTDPFAWTRADAHPLPRTAVKHTRVVTVTHADARADPLLAAAAVVRSAHRGLRVHAPTVIAFAHQHVRPGVVRYVLCASDFQDLVGAGWRAAWRALPSLRELVVLYKPFASLPRGFGDADPGSRPVEVVLTHGVGGPPPFEGSLGWVLLAAVAARPAHAPLRVTMVGFPRFGVEAAGVEFLSRREYAARVGATQYLLESVL